MQRNISLLVVGALTIAVSALIPMPESSSQATPAAIEQLSAVSGYRTSKQRQLDYEYKQVMKEVDSGLRQSGVSPEWRDQLVKKIEKLKKQGLSADSVAVLKAKVAELSVGGERKGASATVACPKDKQPVFTHPFTDLKNIRAVNPIGGIGGGSPGRSYVGVNEGEEAAVYAPTDATLRTIIFADRGAGYGEYGLIFDVGCGVELMFDHLDRVTPKILQYAPKVAAKNSQTQDGKSYTIPVRAGELVGYTNGTDLAHTFDFLVMDYTNKNAYVNPKRWEWEQALYPVCPYDFFTPELRAQYYDKMGMKTDTGFVKAPSCGSPSHDVLGTLSGGWFKGSSTDKRGDYLAIAREYDGVRLAYRKDGNAFATGADVQAGKPYFNLYDSRPSAFPEKVTAGDSVCYSDNREWAYLRLDSATELSLAKGTGPCPASFPTGAVEKWIR